VIYFFLGLPLLATATAGGLGSPSLLKLHYSPNHLTSASEFFCN
jgi:hypothetical protein